MNQTFVDCGPVDMLTGRMAAVTGLEDRDDGALRVFVGPRYKGVYVEMKPEARDEQQAMRNAWARGGHVNIAMPPADCLMQDTNEEAR